MGTPYSQENQALSDAAHLASQSQVYPFVFKCEPSHLEFECTSLSVGDKAEILDGEMGIDRIVRVSSLGLRRPISFCIQERFRNIKYSGFQDLTITTWNTRTGQPSELYKINAGLFLYGFYDSASNLFGDWVIVNTAAMLLALTSGRVAYTTKTNPRSGQEFIGLKFADLYKSGSMVACFVGGKRWRVKNS
jgi:hypothetical protein